MLKLLLCLSFLISLSIAANTQTIHYTHTIDILQEDVVPANPRHHDLMVTHVDHQYAIRFFIRRGSTLENHRAVIKTDQLFLQASFTWVSKHKAAVKLFNAQSGDVFLLKVFGKRATNGMEIETD